jgi:hypothetical protein
MQCLQRCLKGVTISEGGRLLSASRSMSLSTHTIPGYAQDFLACLRGGGAFGP